MLREFALSAFKTANENPRIHAVSLALSVLAFFLLFSGGSRADNCVAGTVTTPTAQTVAGGFHVEVYNASAPFQLIGEGETNESSSYYISWSVYDAGYFPPSGHYVKIIAVNAINLEYMGKESYYGETMSVVRSDDMPLEYADFIAYGTDLPTDPVNVLTVAVSGTLGQSIEGATCAIEYSDGIDAQQGPRDTDETGVANLTVRDGSYTLTVAKAHYTTRTITVEVDHDMIQAVTLQPGSTSTPVMAGAILGGIAVVTTAANLIRRRVKT